MFAKKSWLSDRITLEDIIEVIEQVETVTERFLVNRVILASLLVVLVICVTLLVVGVVIEVKVTNN